MDTLEPLYYGEGGGAGRGGGVEGFADKLIIRLVTGHR